MGNRHWEYCPFSIGWHSKKEMPIGPKKIERKIEWKYRVHCIYSWHSLNFWYVYSISRSLFRELHGIFDWYSQSNWGLWHSSWWLLRKSSWFFRKSMYWNFHVHFLFRPFLDAAHSYHISDNSLSWYWNSPSAICSGSASLRDIISMRSEFSHRWSIQIGIVSRFLGAPVNWKGIQIQ